MNEMTRVEADATAALVAEQAVEKRARWRLPLMIAFPLVLAAFGVWMWMNSGKTVSTDNAQVAMHVVSVAPEVTGMVTEVAVVENQRVRKGDLLFRIDPAPYRIALASAEAAIGEARLQVAQMQGNYTSKAADIGASASDVQLAEENFKRQQELMAKGFTTRAAFDEARANLASAQAKRQVAAADATAARAMLGVERGAHPQVAAAMATRDKAALDLKRTVVRAPLDGIVAEADKLVPGSMAMAMLPSITIVGGGDYWVEANFKETQLAKVRVGQRAEVEIDSMPGRTFRAHVVGIGAGTGSQFSLLPAQNATGNWVKVTQRVPVRLKLDEKIDRAFASGSSANVTIHVAD